MKIKTSNFIKISFLIMQLAFATQSIPSCYDCITCNCNDGNIPAAAPLLGGGGVVVPVGGAPPNHLENFLVEVARRPVRRGFRDRTLRENLPVMINAIPVAARGALYSLLTYKFAHEYSDKINIYGENDKIFFSAFYAVLGTLPMVAFQIRGEDGFLRDLLRKRSNYEKAITRKSGDLNSGEKVIESMRYWALFPMAAISGSTFGYITYREFKHLMGDKAVWALVAPNLYGRAVIDYKATPALTSGIAREIFKSLNHVLETASIPRVFPETLFVPQARVDTIARINNRLNLVKKYLDESITPAQAVQLSSIIKTSPNITAILGAFLRPYGQFGDDIPNPEPGENNFTKYGKKLGGLIGGFGTWAYYNATLPAFGIFHGGKSTEQGLAALALTSATSIFYKASESTSKKFLDTIYNIARGPGRPRRPNTTKYILARTAISSLAFVGGIANASQIFQIHSDFKRENESESMKALYTAFDYSAAFALFNIAYWATDEILMSITKIGEQQNPQIRDLIRKISDLQQVVPKLNDAQLNALAVRV